MGDSAGNWCLIESDPGVFTELIKGFGVVGVECEEIFDLDYLDRVLDAHGLIFLYKWEADTSNPGSVVKDDRLDHIFFAKQVITNACATQALINILMNAEDKALQLGDTLTTLKSFCAAFDSQMKGLAISNSDQIRAVHNSFSSQTLFEFDEKAASKDEDVYHFIGYLPVRGRLYELDGLQDGPIDHGAIPEGQSWTEVARPILQSRMEQHASTNFNLLALVPERLAMYEKQLADINAVVPLSGLASDSRDDRIRDLQEKICLEKTKVQRASVENIRRRHNYLPFIVELLKVLAEKGKLVDFVDKAKTKAEEKRKQKQATKAAAAKA